MNILEKELRDQVKGDIYFDKLTRCIYSVDASIFEVIPFGVVVPRTKEDLVQTLKITHSHQFPVVARGAATGITGGCLSRGIVIDTSRYLNNLLDIDIKKHTVMCEPGMIQDDLNRHLLPFKHRLGPDTSTGNRATLGGMLANNAAGARSLRFGKMSDHILAVDLLLVTGEHVYFESITEEEWNKKRRLKTTEGMIYADIWRIREKYGNEIIKQFPNTPRRVSGYNLDELIKGNGINVAKLIAGSEGTLGIITSLTLNIVPIIAFSGLCLLYFDDLITALEAVPALLTCHPLSLELIDNQIIELGRKSPSLKGQLNWLKSHPKALLILEIDGCSLIEVKDKLELIFKEAQNKKIGYEQTIILDPTTVSMVWALRKAGLGILLSKRTYSRAIAFLEDISVNPNQLPAFMKRFCDYLSKKGKTAGIYGHVGSGCMHIRPYIDLRDPDEISLMRQMMLDVTELLLEYGGALSGEHGDGLIRSWLNPKLFGPDLYQAFIDLKRAFDPMNLMNPGKIVLAKAPFEPLRLSPETEIVSPKTFLNFQAEGGFALSVDLCNGNGQCRKKTGVMCPSFQATMNEIHSTRGRAQALRSIIHNQLPPEDLTSKGMHEVMDLCISCKGCKTECPSQIDMAKMKAEFLYHYQNKHGYSLRSLLFGNIDRIFQVASPFAWLFNRLNQSFLVKKMLSYFLGIAYQRTLPKLAQETFSKWQKKERISQKFKDAHNSKQKQVVLFHDTFMEYNDPSIGKSAIRVLEALGYDPIVPAKTCCGRPAISKGLLENARHKAERVLEILEPYVSQGLFIVGLEPSCILTIKDDYVGLVNETKRKIAEQIGSHCLTFDEFIARHIYEGTLPLPFSKEAKTVLLHGHCHQKALVGMTCTKQVLQSIPNLTLKEIPSGCCGMAGSFGYEKEHYDISMKIGELVLLPAIRSHFDQVDEENSRSSQIEESSQKTFIVADGTSCRQQIQDGTAQKAFHLAEFLALCLTNLPSLDKL